MPNYTPNTPKTIPSVRAELERISNSLEDKLDRRPDEGQENSMEASLDMSDNSVFNLKDAELDHEAVNLRTLRSELGMVNGGAVPAYLTETRTLSNGQLVVNFTRQVSQTVFFVNGEGVDRGRLERGVDFTQTGDNQITLEESYPAGSVVIASFVETDLGSLNNYVQTFSSVADMKEAFLEEGQVIRTKGYYSEGDGGEALYLNRGQGWPETADNLIDHGGTYGDFLELLYSDSLNAKQAGAVGDGVANDTTSIQAALDTFPVVLLPKATYVVDDLLLNQGQRLDLGFGEVKGRIRAIDSQRVQVRNGTVTNPGGNGIELTGACHESVLENLFVYECNEGFVFNGTGSERVKCLNLYAMNIQSSPYSCFGLKQSQFTNIHTYNARWGFNSTSDCVDVQIVNAYFELGDASTTPTGDDSYYSATPEHGIYIQTGDNISVHNITCVGWNRPGSNCGIKIRNSDDTTIIGGLVRDCSLPLGLYVQGASQKEYLRGVRIHEVKFEGIDNQTVVFARDYMATNSPISDVVIESCQFLSPTETGQLNMQLEGPSPGNDITFRGCTFTCGLNQFGKLQGVRRFEQCVFNGGETFATYLGSLSVDPAFTTVIKECSFADWNHSGSTGGTSASDRDKAAIAIGNEGRYISIVGCTFEQQDETAVGIHGTAAGQVAGVSITNCYGGFDMFAFQSGGTTSNFISGCTTFGAFNIPGGDKTLITANNNIILDTVGGTVTVQ